MNMGLVSRVSAFAAGFVKHLIKTANDDHGCATGTCDVDRNLWPSQNRAVMIRPFTTPLPT